jgi:hypothetical protein
MYASSGQLPVSEQSSSSLGSTSQADFEQFVQQNDHLTWVSRAIEAAAGESPLARNDGGLLQVFQSENIPQIPLARYALHLAWKMRSSHGVVQAFVLFLRAIAIAEATIALDMVHRLLLACVVVAMKAHRDDFFVNKYMARIGGVGVGELARLETQLFINILQGFATVREEDTRTMYKEGIVPIGRQLLAGQLNEAGVARKIEYLITYRRRDLLLDRFDSLSTSRGAFLPTSPLSSLSDGRSGGGHLDKSDSMPPSAPRLFGAEASPRAHRGAAASPRPEELSGCGSNMSS